jgi:hypothetical protein
MAGAETASQEDAPVACSESGGGLVVGMSEEPGIKPGFWNEQISVFC